MIYNKPHASPSRSFAENSAWNPIVGTLLAETAYEDLYLFHSAYLKSSTGILPVKTGWKPVHLFKTRSFDKANLKTLPKSIILKSNNIVMDFHIRRPAMLLIRNYDKRIIQPNVS